MDNKLSELSKPIGVSFKSDIDLMKSGRMIHGQMTVWKSRVGIPDSQEGVYSQEYVSALLAELEAKDKRIAEVEGSHKKLRETLAAVHNTITGGGAYTSLAGILTAVKRAYLESSDASACTVTVEGDE
ncbi:hypothetical protein [Serratia proteamaculans]|uniref:hypothetical protein n=1 Tax=Serratia proteamaculans TaxID=28151 RepID=UPI002980C942|nr:hypothetical protein [Serratia proteamaculans]MDW5511767.1 hypothetical protein [Serratia proteamaculans]